MSDATPPPTDSPERDGSDGWHCGNGFLAAERVLRIVERTIYPFAPGVIEQLADLAHTAGPRLCREALEPQVPF